MTTKKIRNKLIMWVMVSNMPVFILLLFFGVAVLWLLLSFCFIPIGKFVYRIIKYAKTSMSKDDYKEKSEEEKDGTEQNG